MQFVKNEWIKLWSQRSTWIMFVLTLVALLGVIGLNRYFTDASKTVDDRRAANEETIAFYEQLIQDNGDSEYTASYQEEIQMAQYRIDNDLISPDTMTTEQGIDLSIQLLTVIVGIFTMVVAASIVSTEFATGTIKMLLTRPVARWKILLSKLVTTLLYGLALLAAGLVVGTLASFILFNTSDTFTLQVVNGDIVKVPVEYYFVNNLLYNAGSLTMTIFFAFMLSTLFGSSTLAVSLALGILFMGSTLTFLLSQYDFAKYLWFANDIAQFAKGSTPIIEGTTWTFALTVNIVYAIVFLGVSFLYFMRRDITA